MSRTIEDVNRDLALLKAEMDVAMAEAALTGSKMRLRDVRGLAEDEETDAEHHAALGRLGGLDRQREVLQQEARDLRAEADRR